MIDALLEFFCARLAEDEAAATSGDQWRWIDPGHPRIKQALVNAHGQWVLPVALADVYPSATDGAHIARHDPARVLADIAVKRQVIDCYTELVERRDFFASMGLSASATEAGLESYEHVLRCWALVHADHPDYRPEFAPLWGGLRPLDRPEGGRHARQDVVGSPPGSADQEEGGPAAPRPPEDRSQPQGSSPPQVGPS